MLSIRLSKILSCWAFCVGAVSNASATSGCYQWSASATLDGWFNDPQEACDVVVVRWQAQKPEWTYGPGKFTFVSFPGGVCKAPINKHNGTQNQYNSTNISVRNNPVGCKVYVSAVQTTDARCGGSCNSVNDRIDPVRGEAILLQPDARDGSGLALHFEHFYSSGYGWRYSYSRRIRPKYAGSDHHPYAPSADNSSLYTTESGACEHGFAEIRTRVASWANASATYANRVCTLRIGSSKIGTLPLFYTSPPTPNPSSSLLIGFEAVRDNGQLVTFLIDGTRLDAPLGVEMELQQDSTGYTLIDANDRIESYDTEGRLMTITARSGVVHTMSYDSWGRLSAVSDTFGNTLTLTYDSQGRIAAVERQ